MFWRSRKHMVYEEIKIVQAQFLKTSKSFECQFNAIGCNEGSLYKSEWHSYALLSKTMSDLCHTTLYAYCKPIYHFERHLMHTFQFTKCCFLLDRI